VQHNGGAKIAVIGYHFQCAMCKIQYPGPGHTHMCLQLYNAFQCTVDA
jgi:hypothetical protein